MKKTLVFGLLFFVLAAAPSAAQDGIPGIGDSSGKKSPYWLKARSSFDESSRVKKQDMKLTLALEEFDLGAKLWGTPTPQKMKKPGNLRPSGAQGGKPDGLEARGQMPPNRKFPRIRRLSATFSCKRREFDGTVILPSTGERLPEEFYSVKASLSYVDISGRRKLWGLRAGFGSASDEPFASSDLSTTSVLFFLSNPAGERDSWMFFLFYSDNRAFLNHVPLPGVAYLWKPHEKFQLLAGIPFLAAKWKPSDKWELSLSANPAPGGRTRAEFKPSESLRFFGVFQAKTESYIRDDRLNYWDRLFLYESRVEAGVELYPFDETGFEVSGGWKFDRFIFEGEGYEDRDVNRIDLENCLFMSLCLTVRF